MNNELTNEISEFRGHKLLNLADAKVDEQVYKAIDFLSPGAMNGLQGLSAAEDGVTRTLWQQAVMSAEMSGALVFPQFADGVIPEDAEPVSIEIAQTVIAGRVARAILIVNGYGERGDDWTQV